MFEVFIHLGVTLKALSKGCILLLITSCSSVDKAEPPIEATKERASKIKDQTLTEQYRILMSEFPPEERINSCKSINYRSHKKLRRNVRNIYLNNPQIAIPNYNGIYLILESPINEGSEWFMINCRTGRYVTSVPTTGDIMFNSESRIIVTKPFNDSDTMESFKATPSALPELIEWKNRKWIHLENALGPGKE